jgi:hypothetical protein
MEPIKVIIKEREVNWLSDYPDDWKFSAGDPFKFPVRIGEYTCFVKRFVQKGPANVSGWNLLIKMRGKYEKNLSRVYDIKRVQEDGEEIYYGFYEYLEGITLDKYFHEPDIDLNHLSNDLFNAIRTLQSYEFWFPDFTEKNIFCQKNGIFALVDVDSAHPASDPPDNDMYGSKDYWVLVFSFYKQILKKNHIRLSDIHGINLNYLQIPFLVLRLKYFLTGKEKDYNSPEFFNGLPASLDEIAPEFREIYSRVFEKGRDPLSQDEINKISEFVEKKIIKNQDIKQIMVAPVNLPVIKDFTVDNHEIKSGGTFTLSWQIGNADRLELYKNGARFKALAVDQKDLTLTDFADGTRVQSDYQLIANKDLAIAKSNPVTIKLKGSGAKQRKTSRAKLLGIGAIFIGFVGILIYILSSSKNYEIRVDAVRLYEDSDFTIHGKSLPDRNDLFVFIENVAANIKDYSTQSLVAVVPKLEDTTDGRAVVLSVNNGKKTIFSKLYMIRNQTIHLSDSAFKARWERALLRPDGDNVDPNNDVLQTNWPGSESDPMGYAKTGQFTMENSKDYSVLRTHPWWLPNGTIKGYFPWCSLKGKKVFRAEAGFVKDLVTGQKSTDGVSFQVWVHYLLNGKEKWVKIFAQHKDYDEKLMDILADLPTETPDRFYIELRVDAGNASNVDWAAWINPSVISKSLEVSGTP